MQKDAYNSLHFWEWALGHHDVWQGFFLDAKQVSRPVFLNIAVFRAQDGVCEGSWACCPDIHAVLGFSSYPPPSACSPSPGMPAPLASRHHGEGEVDKGMSGWGWYDEGKGGVGA